MARRQLTTRRDVTAKKKAKNAAEIRALMPAKRERPGLPSEYPAASIPKARAWELEKVQQTAV
jgi:hypothetical protein